MAADVASRPSPTRIGILRCALSGASALAALFLLCWLGTVTVPLGPSHMYISLFTTAPLASTAALTAGLVWSIVFGGLAGALIAIAYNLFGFIHPR